MALLFNLLTSVITLISVASVVLALVPAYTLKNCALLNDTIPVKEYVTNTGMTIVIARTDGPIVSGSICLATKAFDDNGAPHILEHLIFTGSKDYPFKDALILISNRCLSPGVNAATHTDHTCYTSSHYGKDGFLRLLPVYLNHILYPTLLPSAFKTEVYHVTGEGNDGGVVFSEQEAKISNPGWEGLLRIVHKDSGYASYVGGSLKNLREITTHKMIVDYHKKYYRSENLCITVCGNVTIDDIMKSIQNVEKGIRLRPKLPAWQRPWKTPVPPLKTVTVNATVPSGDDGFADVYIAWRAPDPVTAFRKHLALGFIMTYLWQTLPDKDFGAQSTDAGVRDFTVFFQFNGVPVDKMNLVYPILEKYLKDIAAENPEFDLNAIRQSVLTYLNVYLRTLEAAPSQSVEDAVTSHFLYGSSLSDFGSILNKQRHYEYLLNAGKSFWIMIIREFLINTKYVQFNGIASKAERDRLIKEDEERVPKRIAQLGPKGLKKKADELAKAIEINSRPVPDSLLNSVPLPSAENVNYVNVNIYRTGITNNEKPSGLDLDSWPTYAEAYDCRTDYIYITATFFTDDVEASLRPYLNLFLKLMNERPIEHENPEITALNDFKTVDGYYRIGVTAPIKPFACGSFSQTASFSVQVRKWEYEAGIKYLLARLQYVPFRALDIKESAQKMLDEYPTALAHQYAANDLARAMIYEHNSNVLVHSMLYQKKFLTSLIASLDDEETGMQIEENFSHLRDVLLTSSNMAVHVTANFAELSKLKVDLNGPWQQFSYVASPKTLKVVPDTTKMVAPETVSVRGEIVGIQQETSFLYHASPGITDFNDNDLAALTVALSYCVQMGGPLWSRVRGPGYTYYYRLILIPNEGIIEFRLFRAADVVRAFNETLQIINERIQPDAVWDQTLIDSAKGVAAFDVVNQVPNPGSVHVQSMLLSFRNVSDTYNRDLAQKILAVTIDDVKRVAQLYMTKMLSPTEAKTAVVCNINEGPGIAKGLKQLGFDLPFRTSWDDTLLNKIDFSF